MSGKAFKKILIIARDFPPYMGRGAVMRVLKFAKYLPEYGWQPFVLCEKKDTREDLSLTDDLPPEVRVIDVEVQTPQTRKALYKKRLASDKTITLKRRVYYLLYRSLVYNVYAFCLNYLMAPDASLPWARKAVEMARTLHQEHAFDAFMTSGPPFSAFRTGIVLKKAIQIPWILDFRDGWAGNPLYRIGRKWMIRCQSRIYEWRAVTHSDLLLFVTEPMLQIYQDRYPGYRSKMHVLTNGFDPADFEERIPTSSSNEVLHLVYSGTISGRRSPALFFNAVARALADHGEMKDRLRVTFLGKFHYPKDHIPSSVSGLVDVRGPLPHKTCLGEMAAADAFLLIINTAQGGRTLMSGKIYEYLAFQKPIFLISKTCAAVDLIRRLRAGYITHDSDEKQIADTLYRLYQDWKADRLTVHIPKDALSKFDRKRLTGVLSEHLDGLSAG